VHLPLTSRVRQPWRAPPRDMSPCRAHPQVVTADDRVRIILTVQRSFAARLWKTRGLTAGNVGAFRAPVIARRWRTGGVRMRRPDAMCCRLMTPGQAGGTLSRPSQSGPLPRQACAADASPSAGRQDAGASRGGARAHAGARGPGKMNPNCQHRSGSPQRACARLLLPINDGPGDM